MTPLPRSGELLLIHQSPSSHTPSSRLKPSGLEVNSSKTGLGMEAMIVRSSFQNPVHHRDCLFSGRGESFVDSPSHTQTGPGQVSLPVSPQISGYWARMGSSNTKKLKNTENLENTNIHDLSKCFLLSPGGSVCKWGPRCNGQDPGSHLHSGGSVYLSLIKSNKLVAGICCYLQCHPCPPFLPLRPLICTRTEGGAVSAFQ